MTIQLLPRPTLRRPHKHHPRHLTFDGLESRTVLSAAAPAAAVAPPPAHLAAATATTNATVPLNITGISLTNITQDANGLITATGTLTGTLLGQAFFTPTTLTINPSAIGSSSTSTPVLELQLNPIHLNLLGLHVDTSAICLDITANPSGGLLGQLLGGTGTGTLSGLLSNLGSDLNGLLSGLNNLLNSTGALTSSTPGFLTGLNSQLGGLTGQATTGPGITHILDLSIGPVDLNVLGLNVHLDNCANGPVTVDVTAQRGAGNLLGNLLSDVAHLLDQSGASLASEVSTLLGLIEHPLITV